MTIEQKVKNAVSPLNGVLSVGIKKNNLVKEEYAVLVFADERDTFFADGENQATVTEIQLSYYFKNPGRKYLIKSTLTNGLKRFGFDIINIEQGFDEKESYHYIIINSQITEEI